MRLQVTEIAKAGYCETLVRMDHVHGKVRSAKVQARAVAGTAEHVRFEHGIEPRSSDSRCFIASCVYGSNGLATRVLREYRDARLLSTRRGQVMVEAYYRFSPYVVRFLKAAPSFQRPVRFLLNLVVDSVAASVAESGGEDAERWLIRRQLLDYFETVVVADPAFNSLSRYRARQAAQMVIESFGDERDAAWWLRCNGVGFARSLFKTAIIDLQESAIQPSVEGELPCISSLSRSPIAQ